MDFINCITINTDASFHPIHKVGGYAFYIVCNNFKILKSGAFKTNPTSPIEAEIMCLANAFYDLSKQPNLPKTKLIIINCDCIPAFESIKLKSKSTVGKKAAQLLMNLRLKTSFKDSVLPKFEFRHVKAHSGKKDSRSIANEWCDTEAKKWMRSQIC